MTKRKTLKDLTIKDNFMFGVVMCNEDLCRQLLELILGFAIERVEVSKEKCVIYHSMGKGGRLTMEGIVIPRKIIPTLDIFT